MTNTAARIVWISTLQATDFRAFTEYKHCNGSMRWLATRGIRLKSLQVRKGPWITIEKNGSPLIGLNVSLLLDVSFHECNIGDEEIVSLAHNSPCLSDISLHDCDRVTDASIIALGKCCVQLIAIDIGNCTNITDDGLAAFASCSSNVRAENHLLRSDIYDLSRMSLSGCN